MAIGVGNKLDKYELVEEVGQGGMAVVYRGIDQTLDRSVAIKVLHRHLSDHAEARDRFAREAKAVAKLRHENILEIYDFAGHDANEAYIVTEFIEGSTLKEFISGYAIKFPEVAVLIVIEVCRALGHAHGMGILHRDIKPENIMVRGDGVIKLMDFGIAQMVDLQRMTVTGQLLGSPAYMSPEHVLGRPLDFRTDVFSVGILLYQLVTGELPFSGSNPHEVLRKVAECVYQPAATHNPLVDRCLTQTIDKALAREPDDRYVDIALMQRDLERFAALSGLEDHKLELANFFVAPASYEMTLKTRVITELVPKAIDELGVDKIAGLALCDRILTLDPDNADTLAAVENIGREHRRRKITIGAIAALIVAMFAIWWTTKDTRVPPVDKAGVASVEMADIPRDAQAGDSLARTMDAGVRSPPDTSLNRADATVVNGRPQSEPKSKRIAALRPRPPRNRPDAMLHGAASQVSFQVWPPKSQFRVDGTNWQTLPDRTLSVAVSRPVRIELRNPCCQDKAIEITPGDDISAVKLTWLTARFKILCDDDAVSVMVNKKTRAMGRVFHVPLNQKDLSGQTRLSVIYEKLEPGRRLPRQRRETHVARAGRLTELQCPEF